METIVSPSILAADFNILGEQIQEVENPVQNIFISM